MLPSDRELTEYAKRFTSWIEQWRYDQRLPASTSWYNLFKEIDNDSSGFITFDELQDCVRRELKKGPKTMSHNELKLLWCSLDRNADNHLEKEEMASFFQRASAEHKAIRKSWLSGSSPFKLSTKKVLPNVKH